MSDELIIRYRIYHKQKLWWIGKVIIINNKKRFVPYTDIYSPTGYGYKDRETAKKVTKDLQEAVEKRRRQ